MKCGITSYTRPTESARIYYASIQDDHWLRGNSELKTVRIICTCVWKIFSWKGQLWSFEYQKSYPIINWPEWWQTKVIRINGTVHWSGQAHFQTWVIHFFKCLILSKPSAYSMSHRIADVPKVTKWEIWGTPRWLNPSIFSTCYRKFSASNSWRYDVWCLNWMISVICDTRQLLSLSILFSWLIFPCGHMFFQQNQFCGIFLSENYTAWQLGKFKAKEWVMGFGRCKATRLCLALKVNTMYMYLKNLKSCNINSIGTPSQGAGIILWLSSESGMVCSWKDESYCLLIEIDWLFDFSLV